jgi:glutathione synthase/RimK-type ligase-like ATP-grasp enzyme
MCIRDRAETKKNPHLIREFFGKTIPLHIAQTFKNKSYIIQKEIPIATYQGRPFDLRVSVQKNEHSFWQVTGLIAKVARSGHFLCNVAQGGQVYPLENLLRTYPNLNIETVNDNISRLALNIVQELEEHVQGLADVGLDLAITRDGFPYFIECNGRDQRYSFLNGGMMDTWKQTYFNPIGYARFLLDYQE